MKIEQLKIQLRPLNLDQIKMSMSLAGRKTVFPLQEWQIRALEMFQKGVSIRELVLTFINQGQLISFVGLRELLEFLIDEQIVVDTNLKTYFFNHQSSEPPQGLWQQLFGSSEAEKPSESIIQRLTKVPFLRSLNPEIMRYFLENMRAIQTPKGVRICQAGQTQRSLLCLLEGEASVYKNNKKVATLNEGALFGEAGFFLGQARTADVVTDSQSLVVKFRHTEEFESLIKKERAQQLQKRFWLLHALLHSPTFKNLPDDCFDALIFAGEIKSSAPQQNLIREGDKAKSFFIVIQGELEVFQKGQKIRNLSQGDSFGEIALMLSGGVRTASVQTKSDVLLLEIPVINFYQILAENLFLAAEFEKLSLSRLAADQKRHS